MPRKTAPPVDDRPRPGSPAAKRAKADAARAAENPDSPWRTMKPNKMFPEELRVLVRGYVAAKGETLPPCPACGKSSRRRWTMLCPFVTYTVGPFEPVAGGELAPLTLVCGDHPIGPTKAVADAI